MTLMLATMGRTAAGKTDLAQFLAQSMELFYIPEAAIKRALRPGFSTRDCLDEQLRNVAYAASIAAAEACLLRGITPIVDASFHRHFRRVWLYEAAERAVATLLVLYCICPNEAEIQRRVALRKHSPSSFQTQADSMNIYDFIDHNFDEPTLRDTESRSCSIHLFRVDTLRNEMDEVTHRQPLNTSVADFLQSLKANLDAYFSSRGQCSDRTT